jgi:AcrR family transcriptional regulator
LFGPRVQRSASSSRVQCRFSLMSPSDRTDSVQGVQARDEQPLSSDLPRLVQYGTNIANMGSVPEAPGRDKPVRTYRSSRREQQARRTRQRILAAATAEFLAAGYAPTTMRAVAAAAGVSVPTVELAFGNKARLLKAAIDVAIAGDDEPVPVLQRDWAARAQTTTTVEDFLAVVGEVVVDAAQRAAGLVVAAFEAAHIDPTMRALADQLASQRATTVAWIVDGIMQRSPLRIESDRGQAIDTIWLLMDPVVFCRLTRDRAWTPERFERWFTDSIPRLLLPLPGEMRSGLDPSSRTVHCPRPTRHAGGTEP